MLDILLDAQALDDVVVPTYQAFEIVERRQGFVDEQRRNRQDVFVRFDLDERFERVLRYAQILYRRFQFAFGFIPVYLEKQAFGFGQHTGGLELQGILEMLFEGVVGLLADFDDFLSQPHAEISFDQQYLLIGAYLLPVHLGCADHGFPDSAGVDALAARKDRKRDCRVDRRDVPGGQRDAERVAAEVVQQRSDDLFAGVDRVDEILDRIGERRQRFLDFAGVRHVHVGSAGRNSRIPERVQPLAFAFGPVQSLLGDPDALVVPVHHFDGLLEADRKTRFLSGCAEKGKNE